MTISIFQALPFITSISNYVRKDKISILISCLAIGILFAASYWIYSGSLKGREVKKNPDTAKNLAVSPSARSPQKTKETQRTGIFDELISETAKENEELKKQLKEAQKATAEAENKAIKFEYDYQKLLEEHATLKDEYGRLKSENEQLKISATI